MISDQIALHSVQLPLLITFTKYKQCVVPENIHTPPTEGFFSLKIPTPPEIPF